MNNKNRKRIVLKSALVAMAVVLILIHIRTATALVSYAPGALLQTGDVTSKIIANGTILSEDLSQVGCCILASGTISSFLTGTTTATSTTLLALQSGNVGVATSVPTMQFAVQGAGLFSGNVSAAGLTATGTVTFGSALTVGNGGTGAATLTTNGVLYGNGTGAVGVTAAGASGLVLTGNGAGAAPTYQAVPSGTASSTLSHFVAGEDLYIYQAVYMATATNEYLWGSYPGAAFSMVSFGGTACNNCSMYAQQIQLATTTQLFGIEVILNISGTPIDNVEVSLYSDNANVPGTVIATSTISTSLLSTSPQAYKSQFASAQTITANTKYWIVFSRSGAMSGLNYYQVRRNGSQTETGVLAAQSENSAWATNSVQTYSFNFMYATTAGRLYLTSGSSTPELLPFMGITLGQASSGKPVDIATAGVIDGLSGLTAGTSTYPASPAGSHMYGRGAVNNTANASGCRFGPAASSTAFIIRPNCF